MSPDQPQLSQPVPQGKGVTVNLPMLEMACSGSLQYVYDPDVTMTGQDPYSSPILDTATAPDSFRFEEALFTELCFLPTNFMRFSHRGYQGQLQSTAPALSFRNDVIPYTDVGQCFQLPNGGSSYFSSSFGADKEPTMSFQRYTSSSLASTTGLASSTMQPSHVSPLAPSISSVSPETAAVPDSILRTGSRAAQKPLRIFPSASSSTLSSQLASPLPSPQRFSPQPPSQSQQDPSFYSVLAAHGYIQSADFCPGQQRNDYVSSYLSPMIDGQTGPDMLSPVSDQGLFEGTSEETSGFSESCRIGSSPVLQLNSIPDYPGYQAPLQPFSQVALLTTGSSSSSSPWVPAFTATERNLEGHSLPTAMSRKAMAPVDQVQCSSWTSTSSSASTSSFNASSSSSSTLPVMSSPLKRHFKSPDSDSEHDDLKGIDDDDEEGEAMRIAADLLKRKRNRKPVIKNKFKSKTPVVKLTCSYLGCTVTCASQPSLARHAEAHKWRGLYSPVRCEACQTALSNEFSVQRHILKSHPTSLCRQLRVYSIMRSRIEIESTVRFFPKRPHGKKTVVIDLAHVMERHQALLKEKHEALGHCQE